MFSNPPKVLIVDDEPFNVEIIEEYIEDLPYDVETAEDGQEAWDLLQATPLAYDAIILDRMMPRMTGLELLQKMKGDTVLQSIPVILQTGMAAEEDVLEGMRAGAYYYLTKPFEQELLESVLLTAIQDRMRYREAQEASELGTRTASLMTDGHFKFQTVCSARDLAIALANACPDPKRVVIGLTELLLNAVEHGNLGITYDEKSDLKDNETWDSEIETRLSLPENKDKFVQVSFVREAEEINVVINDQGAGFEWDKYLEMDPDRAFDSHGRGIAMSKMISFDKLQYRGNGSEVAVTIALP